MWQTIKHVMLPIYIIVNIYFPTHIHTHTHIYIYIGQELGTVLKCCCLSSPLKILLYEFFIMEWKYIFLIKLSHG